jgi:hypothetical protein
MGQIAVVGGTRRLRQLRHSGNKLRTRQLDPARRFVHKLIEQAPQVMRTVSLPTS